MIIEINVLVDCSDLQPSLIVNLKTMISDARSICDEHWAEECAGPIGSFATFRHHTQGYNVRRTVGRRTVPQPRDPLRFHVATLTQREQCTKEYNVCMM